ncbi:type VI secretion system-associated protein TagF [Microbulbifer hainanensis]|uniref:type VI secretion system-associated protein TagF n=1 Tax=Microbulbifer hainanensis TaxID=2735675 RepID=UPI0018689A52|nr:type VI secretion system-associated protein TagF [Microbulbifer hainanensis]
MIQKSKVQITGGLYGKLPGHGDFIQRQLPGSFVTPWDEWLQRAVYGSRELIGENWLDYYLTSPIWRFAFTAGVLDERSWAGVLVPSVDSVGRYFPLTMASPIGDGADPFSIQARLADWFVILAGLALEALQNTLQADQLIERFPVQCVSDFSAAAVANNRGAILASGEDGSEISCLYPTLLHRLYGRENSSYSLWWCPGSPQLAPTTLLSPSLPDPALYCTMLGAPAIQM